MGKSKRIAIRNRPYSPLRWSGVIWLEEIMVSKMTCLRLYAIAVGLVSILAGMGSFPMMSQTSSLVGTYQISPAVEDPFPRPFPLPSGNFLLYAPQIASWDDQKHLVMWSAVSYKPTAAKEPIMGVIKGEAETKVSVDARLVELAPFKITEINFPTLSRDDTQKLSANLQEAIAKGSRIISLDRVLAAVDKSQIMPPKASGILKADPPKIFSSSTPAILINFDGEPIFSPIEKLDLKFAVNTNWDVFEHDSTKTYYLRYDKAWYKTSDIKSTWTPATNLPSSFSNLPNDGNWSDAKTAVSGAVAHRPVPHMFVSFEPAELIATTGHPDYVPVQGTKELLWVRNTESDLFRAGPTGNFYYLVAGRWFSSPSLDGPWTFATPNLPEDFKKIPVEHPRSRVLASIPGTDQAFQAVLLASVPHSAQVNRRELKGPDVYYQGTPEFQMIEGTTLERAVNADKDVFRFNGSFYLCYEGIWFHSLSSNGPWAVAEVVPDEIYKIPPSSPAYHVTFVKLEEDENQADEWETFYAESGYTGTMIGWGCAVWGSGWYYPPYYWYGGYYPWYIWYPRTYGFAAWYNPYTGTFGRGAAIYGPFGGAGAFAAYNPRTGTYGRGAKIYGPYGGSRTFAQAWNPRTGTYAQTRQGSSVYGNWGSSYVQRGDDWVRTARVANGVNGNRTSGLRTSEGGGVISRKTDDGRTTVGRTGSGDVYAGRDGNVYRKQDGQWQKWDNGSWNPANKPEGRTKIDPSTYQQLNRDNKNRVEGERRTKDTRTYNTNRGGRSSAGSFRGFGGGGGFRGGGRRR